MNKAYAPAVLLAVVAVALGSAPLAFSGSDGDYTRHWPISIGDAVGTIGIAEGASIDDVRDRAITAQEATDGYGDVTAKLAKAVNDSDESFLVWLLIEQTTPDTLTMYVLDAGTGEQLVEPITKEGGTCGSKKS